MCIRDSLLSVPIAETIFEPFAGGYLYDRGTDGSECVWGKVLAYDPPKRVVFVWAITPHWQIADDNAKVSEVEVRFTAESPERTLVELEHRHLERHGEGWEQLRELRIRCVNTGTFVDLALTPARTGTFIDARFGMEPLTTRTRIFDAVAGKRYFRRWLEQSLDAMQRVAREESPAPPHGVSST